MAKTTTKTLPAAGQLGDLVRHMYHPSYCLDSGTITTAAGQVAATGVRLLGQPVIGNNGAYTLCLAGNIAAANGIIADDGLYDLPAAGGVVEVKLAVWRRGPGCYGAEALPANDSLGTPITPAAFISALAGATFNPPLLPLTPLTPTKTQVN